MVTLGKGRNVALAYGQGSLRARLDGHTVVFRSLELATASPALARLAAYPVQPC